MHSCTIDEPYFSYIINGSKTYEGRVRKGKWLTIRVGDKLAVSSGLDCTQVEFEIVSILNAPSFEHLYFALGSKLLPYLLEDETASDVYRKYFTDDEVKEYGVVALELKRVEYNID